MNRQFLTVLKNDLNIIFKSRYHLILLASLLIYCVYINFIYVNTDVKGYEIFVYDSIGKNDSLNVYNMVESGQELYYKLNSNKHAIGIVNSKQENKLIINESGSERINRIKEIYAISKIKDVNSNNNINVLSSISFKLQKKIEMTSVVVFFEITAISFLTIAAILFKEKQLGIVKIHSILPIKKHYLVLSKIVVFLVLELVFTMVMSFLTIGVDYFLIVIPNVLIQISFLSPIMVMVGYILSLHYNNFKQFIFAYTSLIIVFTSPVFLFVNTSFKWAGIRFFPTYYLYDNLHKAFFNNINQGLLSYLIYGVLLAVLYLINIAMISKEMKRS